MYSHLHNVIVIMTFLLEKKIKIAVLNSKHHCNSKPQCFAPWYSCYTDLSILPASCKFNFGIKCFVLLSTINCVKFFITSSHETLFGTADVNIRNSNQFIMKGTYKYINRKNLFLAAFQGSQGDTTDAGKVAKSGNFRDKLLYFVYIHGHMLFYYHHTGIR